MWVEELWGGVGWLRMIVHGRKGRIGRNPFWLTQQIPSRCSLPPSPTPITPILALHTLWAYVLAKYNYIVSGAVNPNHIQPLAIQVCALYRQALGLPSWTSCALLALPMSAGGPGSPNLELRAAAPLLATYTQASCSRSPAAQAAAAYLAAMDCPGRWSVT